jgi:hypothetical protein
LSSAVLLADGVLAGAPPEQAASNPVTASAAAAVIIRVPRRVLRRCMVRSDIFVPFRRSGIGSLVC